MTDRRDVDEAVAPTGDAAAVVRRVNGWFLAVLVVIAVGGVLGVAVRPSWWPVWLAVVVVASLIARTVMVRAVRRGLDRTGDAGSLTANSIIAELAAVSGRSDAGATVSSLVRAEYGGQLGAVRRVRREEEPA